MLSGTPYFPILPSTTTATTTTVETTLTETTKTAVEIVPTKTNTTIAAEKVAAKMLKAVTATVIKREETVTSAGSSWTEDYVDNMYTSDLKNTKRAGRGAKSFHWIFVILSSPAIFRLV